MAEGFRDLIVWQRSMRMTVAVYKLTSGFPREEVYGLTSQMRRASVSVASNIAEGWGRQSTGEYKQFRGIARGSNLELQTQLVIANELRMSDTQTSATVEGLSTEVSKMLVALMRSV